MKAPVQIPKNLRVIERESFLAAVERRGHALLRAQTENPGNHLLVLFSDPDEKYAVIMEVGPTATLHDLKQAVSNGPAGLTAHYIIPCAQCPPYAMPKGLPATALPQSLAPLTPPPTGFSPSSEAEPAPTAPAAESSVAPSPAPAPVPSMQFTSPRAAVKPPVAGVPSKPVTLPAPTPTPTPAPASPEPVRHAAPEAHALPEAGSLAAMLAKSLQDIERNLADREAEVQRRERELTAREREVSTHADRMGKEREDLRQEALRLNEELEAREIDLFRREADLKSRAEAIVRALREIEESRHKIESIAGRHHA